MGARLLAAYADPRRGYHDLRHLTEVLAHLDELAATVAETDVTAVRLAAWFHDAVYAGRPDDEERSAALARTELASLHVRPPLIDEVERLVLLTAGHQIDPADVSGALLCDADLAILASDPDRYASYAAGVRRDFAHVGDAAFAQGRAAVLRQLLDRPALFATAHAYAHWEKPARHNMATELMLLALGSGAN